jgi:hypothetical protein
MQLAAFDVSELVTHNSECGRFVKRNTLLKRIHTVRLKRREAHSIGSLAHHPALVTLRSEAGCLCIQPQLLKGNTLTPSLRDVACVLVSENIPIFSDKLYS